jgi:hypothetical protein
MPRMRDGLRLQFKRLKANQTVVNASGTACPILCIVCLGRMTADSGCAVHAEGKIEADTGNGWSVGRVASALEEIGLPRRILEISLMLLWRPAGAWYCVNPTPDFVRG